MGVGIKWSGVGPDVEGAHMGIFRDLKELSTVGDTSSMVGTARVISVASSANGATEDLTARVELQIDGSGSDHCVVVTSAPVPEAWAHRVVPGTALSMSIEGPDPSLWMIEWGD
jgi:hypothetical protein